jgi:DNA-binding NarL/FixJ family response regulator
MQIPPMALAPSHPQTRTDEGDAADAGIHPERRANVVRILVAENHDVVRQGIRDLLAARSEWEIVAEARTGRQALDLARRSRPDVAVVDLSLPELAGVEAIRQIRAELPETECCVFTMHEDEVFVGDAIAAGARAYVLKSEPGSRLVEAVDALGRREPFFSPRVATLVMAALVRARLGGGSPTAPLTRRERDVAQLLVEGLGSRAVANRLGITPKTVDTHRAAIMRKLGMSSMADLVRYAIRQRIVEP